MKTIFTLFFAIALTLMFVGAAEAQTCRGSYVTYIVRDAKGKPLDAASSAVSFTGGTSQASKYWKVIRKEWTRIAPDQLPTSIAPLNGTISGLTTSQMCNFREPATLNVTVGGKTMALTFNFPRMGEMQSAEFVVDSRRFKRGKYVIDLAIPVNGYAGYYAATGWKRVR